MIAKLTLALLLTVLTVAGCRTDVASQNETPAAQRLNAKLDQSLHADERALLIQDGMALARYQLDTHTHKWFTKIFGGPDASDVLSYLDERVKHVYAERSYDEISGLHAEGETNASDTVTFAVNLGPALWFRQLLQPHYPIQVRFNAGADRNTEVAVPVTGTRAGLVRIGQAYFDSADSRTAAFRISILVHEARHSDCQDGLSSADLPGLRSTGLPTHRECGHLHSVCPGGIDVPESKMSMVHPYAGQMLCDASPWGAYAVQAVFATTLVKNCKNCSELERQEAMMTASDATVRFYSIARPMFRGEMGEPDMTSRGFKP